jgi:hypothetical protein
MQIRHRFSSYALGRHRSVVPFSLPPSYRRPTSTVNRFSKAPRISFIALQHFRTEEPFCALDRLAQRPSGFALLTRKSHPQGLATLSMESAPRPLEASFNFQRSWALPFRAFNSSPVIGSPFPMTSSALALPCITSAALHRRLSGLIPPEKPYPLFATRRVSPGQGHLLSWAFRLPRFPPLFVGLKRLSLFKLPSCPHPLRTSRLTVSRTTGFSVRRGSASPPKGRLPA